ncbi:lysine--tRNA ligase [Candidatus Foliamicus sp.]
MPAPPDNDASGAAPEHRLIAERRRKLKALRQQGWAFPNRFRPDAKAADLHAEYAEADAEALSKLGREVCVAGRMMSQRRMGRLSFAEIQDASGRLQLMLSRATMGEAAYAETAALDLGDIVWVRGALIRTRSGELSVAVEELALLTKALRPLPEKFHGLSDREQRYRRRYVDLIVNRDSREVFERRARVVAALREFLGERGFMEVETPVMQPIPGGAAARPFVTHHHALDRELFLRVALELHLKRLVVGGMERVFEINRCFRNEGLSTQHNPEFTMLEAYQAYADYDDFMQLTEAMIRNAAESVLDSTTVSYQGHTYELAGEWPRLSMEQAVAEHNPGIEAAKLRDPAYLRAWWADAGIENEPPANAGWGKLLAELFDRTVEHKLHGPVFITGHPAEVSPLSRASDDDPEITDRYELYIAGRELVNGFSELNDAEDQARRFREQAALREGGDDEAMRYDDDFIAALEYGLPPTAGLGLGVDRLVMLLADQPAIRDVLLFPQLRD